jgi:hypothetical protein
MGNIRSVNSYDKPVHHSTTGALRCATGAM